MQDTLNAAAWAVCDTFRGKVEPGLYKDLVLTLLFLKGISDAWQDRLEDCQRRHGEHPALVDELLKNERFVLPPRASFHALHAARYEPGNGERIDRALHALEDANLAKLRDVFRDISFNTAALGDEAHKNDLLRQPAGSLCQAGTQPARKPPGHARQGGQGLRVSGQEFRRPGRQAGLRVVDPA